MTDRFVVARNPDPDSSLPYLLSLPIDGGMYFKTRESWPRASRAFCHPVEEWTYRLLGGAVTELGDAPTS